MTAPLTPDEAPERADVSVGWATLPLTDTAVSRHLAEAMGGLFGGSVMIGEKSRRGRRHLKLRRDSKGYFVMVGARGHDKRYLGICKVTYLDGVPTLFQFTFATHDAFDADQERRRTEREMRA